MTSLPPLSLERKLDTRLWGGHTLGGWLGLEQAPEHLAESWQVYEHNRVADGPYAGQTLAGHGNSIRSTLTDAGSQITSSMAEVDRALEARSSIIRSSLEQRAREAALPAAPQQKGRWPFPVSDDQPAGEAREHKDESPEKPTRVGKSEAS